MNIIYSNLELSHKYIVIFIHGFNKNSSSWNKTDSGKIINIEETIKKKATTVLIDLFEDIYSEPIPEIANKLYNNIKSSIPKMGKIIIVAHSYGAFYALSLAQSNHEHIYGILLLDPIVKSDEYKNYLAKSNSPIQLEKLKNFDSIPNPIPLKNKIIVKICLKVDDDIYEKTQYFDKLTRNNINSDILVYPNRSHMLHYDMHDKIISIIKQLMFLLIC
mgnify:CR=1 FL=1